MKRLVLIFIPLFLMAVPPEGEVIQGTATFSQSDPKTVEIRVSHKAIIHYPHFNIAKDEKVRFIQPDRSSTALNRIVGKDPSQIFGSLQANGKVFLINPNGIIFGPESQISVGSLIASTLDIDDADFMKGKYRFSLKPEAKGSQIVNKGQITAGPEGLIALIAPHVKNEGVITAQVGKVGFLAAEKAVIDFTGDGLISFAVEGGLESAIIEHLGKISAPQGEVYLHLKTADSAIKSVINVEGLVEGNRVVQENGMIRVAHTSSIDAAHVTVAGHNIAIEGAIEAKQMTFSPKKGLHVRRDLSTTDGDLVFNGPLFLDKPNLTFQAGGNIIFSSSLVGTGKFAVHAPNGTVRFDGPVGEEKGVKFSEFTINGRTVDQNNNVIVTGPLLYTGEIHLAGNIKTASNDIIFNGPVILDGQDSAHLSIGYGEKNIVFTSTLDAETPQRAFNVRANGGKAVFKGAIGTKGALGSLYVRAQSISFQDIGGEKGGVEGHVEATADKEINFFGKVFHAKQQTFDTPKNFNFLSDQNVVVRTDGHPLTFKEGTIHLKEGTHFAAYSNGGDLNIHSISAPNFENATLTADAGKIHIASAEDRVGELRLSGREIHVESDVKASSIHMEADEAIFCTRGFGKISASDGNIFLNAKQGSLGMPDNPLWVEAKGSVTVGAHKLAVLKGFSADGFLQTHPINPPAQLFFNDIEYFTLDLSVIFPKDEETISNSPDLTTGIPHDHVDAGLLKPRRAPLYYQP